ncbi:MAG: porin [Cellvibrionaceae bacterium]
MIKSNASKLKLTALATCLAAGLAANPANATITLYEKGPLKYKLKGDWQIQFDQDVGDDRELDLEYDDLELKNIITYDLGNGMTAFGEVHFGFDNGGNRENRDNATRFEEGFLGLDFGGHKISIGQTNSAGDEFGVEKAYEKVGVAEDGFEEIRDRGDDLIRYDGGFGPVSIASSYELESEGDLQSHFDIFAAVKFAGAKIAFAYMDYSDEANAAELLDGDVDVEREVTGISFSYAIGSVDFGADFSAIDYDERDDDVEIYNVVAGFKVGPTGYIGLGVNNIDDGTDDVSGWYANYTYKFANAKNVRLLAEVGDNDADDTDVGYVLGFRILL